MPWYLDFYSFLVRWTVGSAVVLVTATMAVAFLRQPARKLRVIEWSFVACLLLPGLSRIDLGPRWSLSWPGWPQRQLDETPVPEFRPAARDTAAKAAPTALQDLTRQQDAPPVRPPSVGTSEDFAAFRLRRSLDPRLIVVAGYLSCVAVMSAWWLAGYVALRRLLRRSQPADERCRAAWREIAGRRGSSVRLLECPSAAQPFVCGLWRPAIVLPPGLAAGDTVALRCTLAHEWSHVARGDTWWWSLAGLVRVVCFYQPLVWWLRGQMRLAQDCLADAEAAAQSPTAEDYAELLTAWAASGARRPLAAGLGVLGRKSDLYWRIVMLVENRLPLDRRCSRRWDVGIALAAVALLVSAATYGDADDAPPGRGAATDRQPRSSETKEPGPASEATAAKSPPLDQLIDGVLVRARAIRSGRFGFLRMIDGDASGLFNDVGRANFTLSLAGDDWAVRRSENIGTATYTDEMVRRAGRLITLRPSRSPQGRAELRIDSPLSVQRLDVLASVRAGTLPSEAVARFVDEHRYDARLAAGEPTAGFPRTTRMEWKVATADAGRVFGDTSDLLSGGGLLRIDVAEQDGYVLPRVEFVDRFGGVEARFLAGSFVDVAEGVTFPEDYQVSQKAEIHYRFHGLKQINKPLPDDDFELHSVPAGTHVRDFRPRKGPDGKLLEKAGPLQDFTLGAVYGLPPEMLAAMDEGVLSEEETRKVLEADRPDAPAESEVTGRQPAERKGDLRYAGRRFADWREKLLNDLDPSTCADAMPPIAAFGKMGYAEEAVAALAQVLRSDRASDSGLVAQHAVAALVKIGAPAAPALIEGLADSRPSIRAACAHAVAQLGEPGRAAGDVLLKLLDDKAAAVREAAAQSLAAVGGEALLRPTLERLAADDEAGVLAPFLRSLNHHPPQGDWWVEPCLRLANDESRDMRMAVGAMLGNYGPAEKRVIRAVEELIRDDDGVVSASAVTALAQGDGNNVPLLVAVLSDVIKSANLWDHFQDAGQSTLAIARLGSAPEHAALSAPLLVEIVEMRIPNWTDEPLLAIDALGKLGPAAKIAIPALERWIARSDVADDDPYKRHAGRALQKIRAPAIPADEK